MTNRNGPQASSLSGASESPAESKPGSRSPRGAVRRLAVQPVRPGVVRTLERRGAPLPTTTSAPRWRQTFRNARSSPSRSRVTTAGTRPLVDADVARRLGDAARVPDVVPRRPEDPLLLGAEDILVRVPGPRVRVTHFGPQTRGRLAPMESRATHRPCLAALRGLSPALIAGKRPCCSGDARRRRRRRPEVVGRPDAGEARARLHARPGAARRARDRPLVSRRDAPARRSTARPSTG